MPSDLIATAFQISDYLNVFNLSYPTEKAEFLVIDIVSERLKSTALRQSTSRTTQRAQSIESSVYSVEWAVNRDKFITDIKTFVVEYKRWKNHAERARSSTVTPFRKDYSTDAISMHTPLAPSRPSPERGALYDPVDFLILPSIEKSNKILEEASDFSDLSNLFRSNQHTSTSLFIMFDDINNYQSTEFIEQQ